MQDKISDWLKGYLSDAESAVLEKRMEDDTDFARLVEEERLLMQALNRLGQKQLGKKIARWRKDLDNIPPPPQFDEAPLPPSESPAIDSNTWFSRFLQYPVRVRILFIAVLLTALALLAWIYWHRQSSSTPTTAPVIQPQNPAAQTSGDSADMKSQPTKKQPPTRLQFAMNFHNPEYPRENPVKSPASGDPADTSANAHRFWLAQDTLKRGFPRTALRLLSGIASSDSLLYTDTQLWLGHAYFKNRQFESAIAAYRQYEARSSRTDYADWYLLLAYLAAYPGHQQDFKDRLSKITGDAGHTFYNQAMSLKNKLSQAHQQ